MAFNTKFIACFLSLGAFGLPLKSDVKSRRSETLGAISQVDGSGGLININALNEAKLLRREDIADGLIRVSALNELLLRREDDVGVQAQVDGPGGLININALNEAKLLRRADVTVGSV